MSTQTTSPTRWTATPVAALLLKLVLLLSACSSGDPADPEALLRQWLEQAERTAEAGDLGGLKTLLAYDYVDSYGNDRSAAANLLRLSLLRNRSPHLLTGSPSITFASKGLAQVDLAVAMANVPLDDALSLGSVRAELIRFELLLRGGGADWQIIRADWEPAEIGDFL